VYQECESATPATKETEVPATFAATTSLKETLLHEKVAEPATSGASTSVIPAGTLPCPPVRSEDPDHPWTVEWYKSTEPVSPKPGSFELWGVEKDMSFGMFTSSHGVINFVNDSGFLTNLYPATHPLWESCLTVDMCKRNGLLDYVLKGAWATYLEDRSIRYQITKREWDAYKSEVSTGGLKPRKKDIKTFRHSVFMCDRPMLQPQEPPRDPPPFNAH
jgi:hypothetical protein